MKNWTHKGEGGGDFTYKQEFVLISWEYESNAKTHVIPGTLTISHAYRLRSAMFSHIKPLKQFIQLVIFCVLQCIYANYCLLLLFRTLYTDWFAAFNSTLLLLFVSWPFLFWEAPDSILLEDVISFNHTSWFPEAICVLPFINILFCPSCRQSPLQFLCTYTCNCSVRN